MIICGLWGSDRIGFDPSTKHLFVEGRGQLTGINGPSITEYKPEQEPTPSSLGFIAVATADCQIEIVSETKAALFKSGKQIKPFMIALDPTKTRAFPLSELPPELPPPPTPEEVMRTLEEKAEEKDKTHLELPEEIERELPEDDFPPEPEQPPTQATFSDLSRELAEEIEGLGKDLLPTTSIEKRRELFYSSLPELPQEVKSKIDSQYSKALFKELLAPYIGDKRDFLKLYFEYGFKYKESAMLVDLVSKKQDDSLPMVKAMNLYRGLKLERLMDDGFSPLTEESDSVGSEKQDPPSTLSSVVEEEEEPEPAPSLEEEPAIEESSSSSVEEPNVEETAVPFLEEPDVEETAEAIVVEEKEEQPEQKEPSLEEEQPAQQEQPSLEEEQPEPEEQQSESAEPSLGGDPLRGILFTEDEFAGVGLGEKLKPTERDEQPVVEEPSLEEDPLEGMFSEEELADDTFEIPDATEATKDSREDESPSSEQEERSLVSEQVEQGSESEDPAPTPQLEPKCPKPPAEPKQPEPEEPKQAESQPEPKQPEQEPSTRKATDKSLYYQGTPLKLNMFLEQAEVQRTLADYLPFKESYRSKYKGLPFITEEACCYYHHMVTTLLSSADIINNTGQHRALLDFAYTIESKVASKDWVFNPPARSKAKPKQPKAPTYFEQPEEPEDVAPTPAPKRKSSASAPASVSLDEPAPSSILNNEHFNNISDMESYEFITNKFLTYDKLVTSLRSEIERLKANTKTQLTEEMEKVAQDLRTNEELLNNVNATKEELLATLEQARAQHEAELADAKISYAKDLEEQEASYEAKLSDLSERSQEALATLKAESLAKLGKLAARHETDMEKLTLSNEEEVRRVKENCEAIVTKITADRDKALSHLTETEEKLKLESHTLQEELEEANKSIQYWKDKLEKDIDDSYLAGKNDAFIEYNEQISKLDGKYKADQKDLEAYYNKKVDEARGFYETSLKNEEQTLAQFKAQYCAEIDEAYREKKNSDDIARAQTIQQIQDTIDFKNTEIETLRNKLESADMIPRSEHVRQIEKVKQNYAEAEASLSETEGKNMELSEEIRKANLIAMREITSMLRQGEVGKAVILAHSIDN